MHAVTSSSSSVVGADARDASLLLRRRRDAYQRSQTVTLLPSHVTTCIGHVTSSGHVDVPTTRRSSRSSRGSTGSAGDQQQLTAAALQGQGQGHPGSTTATTIKSTPHSRRPSSRRLGLLGRTPSSPSVLLSKVRDMIRDKVVETALDGGPHAAAIERERRMRAADAFEAQRRRQQRMSRQATSCSSGGSASVWNQSIDESSAASSCSGGNVVTSTTGTRPTQTPHGVVRRTRTRSDPARHPGGAAGSRPPSTERVESGGRVAAAQSAFRERSTSEDTYNRDDNGMRRAGVCGQIRVAHGRANTTRRKDKPGSNLIKVTLDANSCLCLETLIAVLHF